MVWIVALAAALVVFGVAHGQTDVPPHAVEAATQYGVVVWTDDAIHERGSVIIIHGYSQYSPVTILVSNPSGNLADVHQLDAGGPFTIHMDTDGPYWSTDGWYRLTAQAGPDQEPFPLVLGVNTGCDEDMIPMDAGEYGIHCIRAKGAGAATLDGPSRTLYMHVYEESATVQIPRYLLDSQQDGVDTDFAVIRDDMPLPYQEVSADADSRTIAIQGGGSVRISGTQAIPEFSAVLAVAAAALAAACLIRHNAARI